VTNKKNSSANRWPRRRPTSGMWSRVVWYKLASVFPTSGYPEHRDSSRRNSKPAGTHILHWSQHKNGMWAVDSNRVGISKQEWVCPAGLGTSDVVIGRYKPSPRPTGGSSPAHVAMTTRDEGGMMTRVWGQLMMSWVVNATCLRRVRQEYKGTGVWALF